MSETSEIVRPAINAINSTFPGVAFAWRIQSGKVRVRGGFLQLAPPGMPDISVCVRGALVMLEAKRALSKKGTVKYEATQLPMHDELRRCGARVEVVRSVAEAIAVVREILASASPRALVSNEVGSAAIGVTAEPLSKPPRPSKERKGRLDAGE